MQEQKSEKVVVATRDLPKTWDQITPVQIKDNPKSLPYYEYGSRLRTKFITFLNTTQFFKDQYDYYLNLPAKRLEEEAFEEYKLRQKFIRTLEKFRQMTQYQVFMNTVEDLRNKQKEK